MKRFRGILWLLVSIGFVPVMIAQDKDPAAGFLFEEYQDAIIHFKGGLRSAEKVNFNLIDNHLYFIDSNDGYEKIVTETGNIGIIKVGDRNFIKEKDGFLEVMPVTPPIYVQYRVRGKRKAPETGYGGRSETAAVTSYSEYRDGSYYRLKEAEIEVTSRSHCYWIERKGQKKKFADFKQFLKLYSTHKNVLEEYIRSNQIDFEDVQAIVNLCLYAESL